MVVDDLHVMGVTPAELETYPPGAVHGHRPLIPACSLELVESDTLERTQVAQGLSDVQREQKVDSAVEVQTPESVRSLAVPHVLTCCIAP